MFLDCIAGAAAPHDFGLAAEDAVVAQVRSPVL
jgi:hypothetical protein